MKPLSMSELLTILNLTSKACEFKDAIFKGMMSDRRDVEANQFLNACALVEPVLGKFDDENPGMLAVPHDGRTWSQRVKEA